MRQLRRVLTGLGVALLIAGCTTMIDSRPVSVYADPFSVGGLPALDGPSGLRSEAERPLVQATGSDGGPVDMIARQAISDIETFWAGAYQQTFTGTFEQVGQLFSWDAREPRPTRFCMHPTFRFANAVYCLLDNTVGWDRGIMMPVLRGAYGDMAITMVLAHEYGHAISRMAKLTTLDTPVLVREQQADCLAGVYLRWVAEDDSPRFRLSTGNGLNDLLAVLVGIRDPLLIEGDPVDDEHGSAFERISAFQFGFTEGARSCGLIDTDQIESRRHGLPVALQADDTGEWPVTAESVATIVDELTARLSPAEPPALSFDTDRPCADARPSPPASYCPERNEIVVDLPELTELGTPPEPDEMSFESALSLAGDNTAYSVLMSRYMLAVQHQRGDLALDTAQAGLRTACMTGSATAMLAEPFTSADGVTITLSAGDLDEAVTGLLTNGVAASDVNGDTVPAGFARIDAFRTGVYGDIDRCIQRYP
ncbi:peptidase [Mycolicibacillus trivialis]